jgi:ABC-2 type transport system permease protein
VARTERKRIGVVNSGIRLFGGLDFQTFRSTPPWAVVEELRKQYEVVEITPSGPITEEVDGLVAVLPSSLSQEEMDHLQAYIEQGQPTLLLVDPLPTVDLSLSPSEEPGTGQNPFMQQNQPPPTPKGDIQALLTSLGVRWDSSSILWDAYNPHPDLAHLPPEVVFVGTGNQSKEPFNLDHRSTAELQELAMLYPGHLSPTVDSASNFEPLVTSSQISGTFPYFQMVQRGFLGAQLNRNLPHRPDESEYVLAAHIRSGDQLVIGEAAPEDSEEASESGAGSSSINAIVVADLDFISQQFFQIRQMGAGNLNFDNVTFFLNAIDVLVGDESFVTLRNRRVRHRTLTTVEANTSSYIEQRAIEEQQAESEADQALAEAQSRLDTRIQEVQNREDLDQRAKEIMARNLQEVENRRFEVLKTNIEAERDMQIESSKETMESQIRNIQSSIRTFAVLLPPIPVFALGVMVFIRRQRRERASTAAIRRVRT